MKPSDKEADNLRLQVFISRNSSYSRRKAMELIFDGRVSINGSVVKEPSVRVNSDQDKISIDGRLIQRKTFKYIMLNKPAGFTTTKSDRFAQKTIYDLIPKDHHYLSPVGRLDKDTEGLLLLTNDGDLAHWLTHPKFNIDKTYFVKIEGELSKKNQEEIRKMPNIVIPINLKSI